MLILDVCFVCAAGLDKVISQIQQQLIFSPVQVPGLYRQLGVVPPCGLLLHGSTGVSHAPTDLLYDFLVTALRV